MASHASTATTLPETKKKTTTKKQKEKTTKQPELPTSAKGVVPAGFASLHIRGCATTNTPSSGSRPFNFYSNPVTLFDALSAKIGGIHPVRLLKSEFLLARARQLQLAETDAQRVALALPRRQELERLHPEAFFSVDELRCLPTQGMTKQLAMCAVSHAWATAEHPDPNGEQLQNLLAVVRRAQAGELPSQQERDSVYGNWRCCPLTQSFGVFYDWCSLPQKGPDGARSPEEQAAFSAALSTMQLWYVHPNVFTVLLTAPPRERVCEPGSAPHTPYAERGWPTVEMAWAMLCKWKATSAEPALGAKAGGAWPPILDAGSPTGEARWRPPMHPDRLEALLSTKRFTSPKADLPLVLRLYRETAVSVLGGIEKLRYTLCGWDGADARALADVLPLCTNASALILFENPIGDEGVDAICAAIVAGALPNLAALNFNSTGLGDDGLRAIVRLLKSGGAPKLTRLHIRDHHAGRAALDAVMQAARSRPRRCQKVDVREESD